MDIEKNILIIEKDLPLTKTFKQIFRKGGYRPQSTQEHKVALGLIAAGDIDLVLLDLNQTHDFGLSLFFKIKRDFPLLPVVLLTHNMEGDAIPCLDEEEAWVEICKPFEPADILSVTKELIEAPMTV